MLLDLHFPTTQCTEAGVPITPRPSIFRKEIEVDELEVGVLKLHNAQPPNPIPCFLCTRSQYTHTHFQ